MVFSASKGVNSPSRSPRMRAIGYPVLVALIMLAAAALGSIGAVVAPAASSGGTVASSALSITTIGSTTTSSSQTVSFSVQESSNVATSIPPTLSAVASASPAPPAFDTDPAQNCTGGCDTSDWFGGPGGSGALSITTGAPNELLVLEVTDSGESGNALSRPDVSDSQGSVWNLEEQNVWNGTGNNQSIFAAIDPNAGADTVLLDSAAHSGTGASSATGVLAAFSGVDTNFPLGAEGAFATGTGTVASASVTSHGRDSTILGILSTSNAAFGFIPTASPAFTEADAINDSTATSSYLEYYGASPPSTYTSAPTWTGSLAWGEEAVAVDSALTVAVSPTSVVMDQGQQITLTATPSGGAGGYTYSWSVASGSCPGFSDSAAVTLDYTPTGTTSDCELTVTVTDSNFESALPTSPVPVTVDAAPTVSITPTSVVMDVGQSVALTASPAGGTGSFTYSWSVASGSCPSFANSALSTLTYTPSSPTSNCVLTVTLTDTGTTGGATPTATATPVTNAAVTAKAAPTVSLSPTSVVMDVGQSVTITATSSGGSGTFAFTWSVASGSCPDFADSGITTLTYTPGSTTTDCVLTVTLTDTGTTGGATPTPEATPSTNAAVTVDSAVSVTISPTSVVMDGGQSVTITATPGGGTGSFTYSWSVASGTCPGFADSGLATLTYTPSGPTTNCVLTVTVTDTGTTGGATPTATATPTTTAAVTVDSAVSVTISPTSVVMDRGQSVTITASPSGGTGSYSFTWSVASGTCTGFVDSGASTLTYTPSGTSNNCVLTVSVTDTGTVGGPTGGAASPVTPASVTVKAAPTVSISPTSVVMDRGQTVTITAAPLHGTGTFAYVWSVASGSCPGFVDSGASTLSYDPSLTTTNCVLTVTITDTGTTGGATPTLTATPPTNAAVTVDSAPTVTISPTSILMDNGQHVTITATPSGGTGSFTYVWSIASGGCPGFSNSGLAALTYTPSGITANCVLTVTLTDTGTTGGATPTPTATPATNTGVTVKATPTVSISPTSVVMDRGQSVTITATPAGGTGTFTYVWSVASGSCPGFANSGASTLSYTPSGTTSNCVLTVTLTDTGTTGGSTPALTANPASPTSVTVDTLLSVTISPTSVVMDLGQSVTITASPSGGTGTYAYTWSIHTGSCPGFSNSGAIALTYTPSGTTSTCVLTVSITDSGTVGSPTGGAASPVTGASVTVDTAPSVTISPTSVIMDHGQSVTITASASGGTGTFGYTWSIDSGSCPGFVDSAAATLTYTPSGTTTNCVLTVTVTDTGTTGGATPAAVATPTTNTAVTVDNAPTVTLSPTSVLMDHGQSVTITATPSGGSGTFAYVWSVALGSCPGFSNSGAATLTYTPSMATGGCTLTVTLTDTGTTGGASPAPTATPSTNAAVTVKATPTVSIAPTSVVMDQGQSVTITATPAGGSGTFTYAWSIVSGGCPGFSNSGAVSLTYAPTGTTNNCLLTVTLTDTGTTGGATPTPTANPATNAAVTVKATLTVSISPTAVLMDQGQSVTITATPVGGTASFSYAWSIHSGSCPGFSNPATITLTFTPTGTSNNCVLTVIVTDIGTTGGSTPTPTASPPTNAAITVKATPTVSLSPTSVVMDQGQSVTITATTGGGTGTFTYAWAIAGGLCPGFANSGASTLTYAPTGTTTTCMLTVTLTDTGTTGGATPTPTATPATNSAVDVKITPTVSISPTSVVMDQGQSVTITATPAGGTGAFSYVWSIEAGSCPGFVNSGISTLTYSPSSTTSNCVLTVTATDTGTTGGASPLPTATPATNSAVTVDTAPTLTLSPLSVLMDRGQSVTITASPSGGSGTFTYVWSVALGSCPGFSNSGAISLTYTPSLVTASCTLTVTLTDAGTTGGATPTITATPPTNSVVMVKATPTVSLSPTSVVMDQGQSVTITATPAGGTGTFTYAWSIASGGCPGFSNSGAAALTYGPTGTTNNCVLTVLLTDTGTTGGATPTPTATPSTNAAVSVKATPTVAISPTTVLMDQGQSVTITATPAGGTGPFTYAWSVHSGTCPGFSNSGAITLTFTPTGTSNNCVLTVTLTDTGTTGGATPTPTALPATNAGVTVKATPTMSIAPTSVVMDQGQSVTITATPSGGTGTFTYLWSIATGSCPAFSNSGLSTLTFTPTGTTNNCVLTITVTDTGTTGGATPTPTATPASNTDVTVDATPTVTIAPTSVILDQDQSATLTATPTGGTGTFSYAWSVSSGSCPGFADSGMATLIYSPIGTTSNCILTVTLTDTGTTGGATPTPTATPTTDTAVTVNSMLTAPGAPAITSNPIVDRGQTSTLTATVPSSGTTPYSWQWLYSTDGGSHYNPTTSSQCATPSGSGASGGTLLTCSFVTTGSTTVGSYLFELKVTDSATTAEIEISTASSTVTVNTALLAPLAPTPSATSLDADQLLTVSGTIPSTGTATYSWQWLVSVDSGSFVSAAQCGASASGSGASAGAGETCTIPANTLTASTSYNFKLKVTDSATVAEIATSLASVTVMTSSALTAGTPSPATPILDLGQSVTLTANPSGGASGYTFQWYSGGSPALCTELGSPIGSATSSTYLASPASTTYYCYNVTDANHDNATSAVTDVTVNSALTAPSTPSVSATALDLDQTLTVDGTIPNSGTASYSWQWLVSVNGGSFASATQCGLNSGSGASGGSLKSCVIASNTLVAGDTYSFELQVMDSASSPETQPSPASSTVAASAALTAPSAPTPSASKLDVNQALSVSGSIPNTGAPTYAWQWLVSVNGGASVDATVCAANSGSGADGGAAETCSIAASTLTVGDAYGFELKVTDSATSPETQNSAGSSTVAVKSALTTPGVPSSSATALDVDQALTVSGTVPSTGTSTYSWQWLVSVNGGVHVDATQCTVDGGSGAVAGASELCAISGSTLTVGDSYSFELKVTDSASTAETQTSPTSTTVTVSSALTAPAQPVVSASALDIDQALMVSGIIPSNGTASYSWQWMVSVNGGAYAAATQCTVGSGSGAAGGATENCSVASNSLTAKDSYTFQLELTDSASSPETQTSISAATVAVSAALTAAGSPAPSSTNLDTNQPLAVTATIPSTGAPTYSWQWLVSVNGGSYGPASQCASNSGNGADSAATATCSIAVNKLTAGDAFAFEIRVTDNATVPESATSTPSATVTVNSVVAAAAPTPLSSALDIGQTITLTANPTGGSVGYAFQWYQGASASACTSLGAPISGAVAATYLASPTSTTYYCYTVTDSASPPETSPASTALVVSVSPALTAPSVPTSSATSLSSDQGLTVTATIPSSGTPAYAWQWLVAVNGGEYESASQCAVAGGSGAAAGATETCSVPANTLTSGDSYSFELQVTDNATSPVSMTSAATSAVSVTAPSTSSSLWLYIVIAVVVLLVLLLVALVVLRRRRPRPASAPPMQVWQEEPTPPMGAPIGPAPDYLETPEDVGHTPPLVPVPTSGAGVTPPVPPPGAEGEPDIDALMAELDKISGEILKKPSKVPKDGEGEDLSEEEDKTS